MADIDDTLGAAFPHGMAKIDETLGAAFPHDDDYRALNLGAHPIVPPRLSAPALNWHVAVWNPRDVAADGGAWYRRLAQVVLTIFNRLEAMADPPPAEDSDEAFEARLAGESETPYNLPLSLNGRQIAGADPRPFTVFNLNVSKNDGIWTAGGFSPSENPFRYETASAAFLWGGQLVKLSIQFHSEYTTFTFWLPVFRMRLGTTANPALPKGVLCRGPKAYAIRRHIASTWCDIVATTTGMTTPEMVSAMAIRAHDVDASGRVRIGTSGAHNYLYESIWQELSQNLLPELLAQSIGDARPELMRSFADFRSIILPSNIPFSSRDTTTGWTMGTKFPQDQATKLLGSLTKFFTQEAAARAEVTGSLFLDGRVAYVSSLGSQAGQPGGVRVTRHELRGRSTRFAMVARPMPRWQLGRLTERLNTLGTYRLAALRNLPQLNGLSRDVRVTGDKLDVYRRQERRLPATSKDAAKSLDQWLAELGAIRSEFAAIGAAGPDGLESGLSYRVERSRFYVKRFAETIEDLRIERVEGFQPYDEFVRRRYAGTWDRIYRLGDRYQRLQQRLDQSGVELVLLEQSRQTSSVVESTNAQNRQTRKQSELLRAAEWFAIFPISYYGGSLLIDACDMLKLNPGKHGLGSAVVVASLYSMFLSWRTREDDKDEASEEPSREAESRNWFLLSIGLAVAAFALFCLLPKQKDGAFPLSRPVNVRAAIGTMAPVGSDARRGEDRAAGAPVEIAALLSIRPASTRTI